MRSLAALIIAFTFAACDSTEQGSVVVEREQIGDTTIVRTISGSVWGDTARLAEELRIGALDGPKEVTFGAIDFLTVGHDGSIYALDRQAVALRVFDSTGAFVRSIGGRGQGPGEYTRMVRDMRVLSDGRVALFDLDGFRVTIYSPSGDLLHTISPRASTSVCCGSQQLAVDTSNHLYLLTRPGPEPGPLVLGATPAAQTPGPILLRIDPTGTIVDTLSVPRWPAADGPPLYRGPTGHWAFHPHGYFVAGRSDRYSFDVRQPGGRVVRVERQVPPIAFEPEERAELEKVAAGLISIPDAESRTIEVPPGSVKLPPVKPAYRNLIAADDGRIWVSRYTPATRVELPPAPAPPPGVTVLRPRQWREATVFDVFEPDGRFLGPVAVPSNAVVRYMRGSHVWGTVRGDSDEQYVVRWKLDTAPSLTVR